MRSLVPGNRVWISPTEIGSNAATRINGPGVPAAAAQAATTSSWTASGMIFTVATRSPGATGS